MILRSSFDIDILTLMFIFLPAAKLVDQPAHYWPDQHVDPAQEATHPGHRGTVTGKMLHQWHQYQTKYIGDTCNVKHLKSLPKGSPN